MHDSIRFVHIVIVFHEPYMVKFLFYGSETHAKQKKAKKLDMKIIYWFKFSDLHYYIFKIVYFQLNC